MNKYKKLAKNTLIFAIGTFSSKILVFLMMPLYTSVLSVKEYGTADLVVQVCNFLLPFASLGITNSIVVYGLDKKYKKSDILTTSIVVVCVGSLIFFIIKPFLIYIEDLNKYSIYIFIFLLTANLRAVLSQFVRAKNYLKLYSFDGILSTFTNILFTILFLITFDMGVKGYILAIIVSDAISILFLFTIASLQKFIKIKTLNIKVSKKMLTYSIPLIPTTVFWWIINISDRFILTNIKGLEENGLYAIAYKAPMLITLASSIFLEAWQMSAISETKNRQKFFSKIFTMYSSILFILISFLILNSKVFTNILVSKAFYESWKYIPILTIATGFSCFVSFLGSIYMTEKKSVYALYTIIIGAIVNIVLNFLLIPKFGAMGAAIATFISFFSVFLIRIINTRKYVKIKTNYILFFYSILLMILQSIIMIKEISYNYLFSLIIFIIIIIIQYINFKKIIKNKKRFQK